MNSGSDEMVMRTGEGEKDDDSLLPNKVKNNDYEVTLPETGKYNGVEQLHPSRTLALVQDELCRISERQVHFDENNRSDGTWYDQDKGVEYFDPNQWVFIVGVVAHRFEEFRIVVRKICKETGQVCIRIKVEDVSFSLPDVAIKLVYKVIIPQEETRGEGEQQVSELLKRVRDGFGGSTCYKRENQLIIEVDSDGDRIEELRHLVGNEAWEVKLVGKAWYEYPTKDDDEDD